MSKYTSVALIILISFLFSCGNGNSSEPIDTHTVKGRYLSTDLRGESISVIHETVPGVMNSMRMSMRIEEPSMAEGLETGDIIEFEMVRTDAGWHAKNIRVQPSDTELDLPDELKEVGVPDR